MTIQSVGPWVLNGNLTNVYAEAWNLQRTTLVQTSGVLASAAADGVSYFVLFDTLPQGEYFLKFLRSDDTVAAVGYTVIASGAGPFKVVSSTEEEQEEYTNNIVSSLMDEIERTNGFLDRTLKLGDRLRFSDADGSTVEQHDVTITRIT